MDHQVHRLLRAFFTIERSRELVHVEVAQKPESKRTFVRPAAAHGITVSHRLPSRVLPSSDPPGASKALNAVRAASQNGLRDALRGPLGFLSTTKECTNEVGVETRRVVASGAENEVAMNNSTEHKEQDQEERACQEQGLDNR